MSEQSYGLTEFLDLNQKIFRVEDPKVYTKNSNSEQPLLGDKIYSPFLNQNKNNISKRIP